MRNPNKNNMPNLSEKNQKYFEVLDSMFKRDKKAIDKAKRYFM